MTTRRRLDESVLATIKQREYERGRQAGRAEWEWSTFAYGLAAGLGVLGFIIILLGGFDA